MLTPAQILAGKALVSWQYKSLQDTAARSASVLLRQTNVCSQRVLNPHRSHLLLSAWHNPAQSTGKFLQVSPPCSGTLGFLLSHKEVQ